MKQDRKPNQKNKQAEKATKTQTKEQSDSTEPRSLVPTWGPPAEQLKESAMEACGYSAPSPLTLKQLGCESNQAAAPDPALSLSLLEDQWIFYYEGPIRKGNAYSKQVAGRVDWNLSSL